MIMPPAQRLMEVGSKPLNVRNSDFVYAMLLVFEA